MKNSIVRGVLRHLAKAPQIAATHYLISLPKEDREECIRLLKALKIYDEGTLYETLEIMNIKMDESMGEVEI